MSLIGECLEEKNIRVVKGSKGIKEAQCMHRTIIGALQSLKYESRQPEAIRIKRHPEWYTLEEKMMYVPGILISL